LIRNSALAVAPRYVQVVVLAALLTLAALAWGYVIWLAAQMSAPSDPAMSSMPQMDGMMAPGFSSWTFAHFLFIFMMWSVMMAGMMIPSVTPMVLIYARVTQQGAAPGRLLAPAGWFATGYLIAWSLFAAFASLAQWGLEKLALISPMMAGTNHKFGGAVLIAAGVYQWLPIKDGCLGQCREPLAFIQRHGGFQTSAPGSLRLGLLHGKYCVGCCWALMAILFVVGVMNLLWIAILMIIVLLEKVVPGGRYFSRFAGGAALAAGLWMIKS
jgi:predicted metal-binding membrane protein